MRSSQRTSQARELANGLISFVSHRLNEAQDIVGQWMLSEERSAEGTNKSPGVGTSESCRWSFHQLGHGQWLWPWEMWSP